MPEILLLNSCSFLRNTFSAAAARYRYSSTFAVASSTSFLFSSLATCTFSYTSYVCRTISSFFFIACFDLCSSFSICSFSSAILSSYSFFSFFSFLMTSIRFESSRAIVFYLSFSFSSPGSSPDYSNGGLGSADKFYPAAKFVVN